MPASWRVRGGLSRSARAAAARPTHVRAPRTLTRIKTAGARRAHHGGMYTSRAAAMSAPIALDEARLAILVDRDDAADEEQVAGSHGVREVRDRLGLPGDPVLATQRS